MTTPRMLTGGTYFFNFGFISLQECSLCCKKIQKQQKSGISFKLLLFLRKEQQIANYNRKLNKTPWKAVEGIGR